MNNIAIRSHCSPKTEQSFFLLLKILANLSQISFIFDFSQFDDNFNWQKVVVVGTITITRLQISNENLNNNVSVKLNDSFFLLYTPSLLFTSIWLFCLFLIYRELKRYWPPANLLFSLKVGYFVKYAVWCLFFHQKMHIY